jgi:hypothetical protein
MYDQEINNAWTELNDALTANRHGLGSEQYTKLINLADKLANLGDDQAFKLTGLQLEHINIPANGYITPESGAPKWSISEVAPFHEYPDYFL